MNEGIGLLEITGLSPALVALDTLEKAARVRLVQMELNDFYGVFLKIAGSPADLRSAMAAGTALIEQMGGKCLSTIIDAPDDRAWPVILSKKEFSPLLEASVVYFPDYEALPGSAREELNVNDPKFAIGLIETQGFTAAMEAIDSACKAANVEPIGKEKLGGGYITILFKGDIAAVQTAVEVGRSKVEGLGKLIAAHVIARPSDGVLSLLPKS